MQMKLSSTFNVHQEGLYLWLEIALQGDRTATNAVQPITANAPVSATKLPLKSCTTAVAEKTPLLASVAATRPPEHTIAMTFINTSTSKFLMRSVLSCSKETAPLFQRGRISVGSSGFALEEMQDGKWKAVIGRITQE